MKNCKIKILNQSENCNIFKCQACEKIHIEYKNLNFTFSEDEFLFFKNYFLKLEPEKWERINQNTIYNRKIIVPIGHNNFTAMFNAEEIHEIKNMFTGITQKSVDNSFIGTNKISVKPCLN